MKAFYYPLLLKRLKNRSTFYFGMSLLLARITSFDSFAQSGFELGDPAYSTLSWDHISTNDNNDVSAAIGKTRDGRVYTWGSNKGFYIKTGLSKDNKYIFQVAPYFVQLPAGETAAKVRMAISTGASAAAGAGTYPNFFCLTTSGKMYAWGINRGLAGSDLATFPRYTSSIADNDSTRAKRSPILMTNIGESTFVDMDFSSLNGYGVVIGASGTAYHIGTHGSSSTFLTTFAAMPKPAGVSAGFKYTNVWVSHAAGYILIYLKGDDGNVYFTGSMSGNALSGVPSIYYRNTPAPTLTSDETAGNVRNITPRLVPFPAGEDIIEIKTRSKSIYGNTYAISASGKAYTAGAWRFARSAGGTNPPGSDYFHYVVAPLKTAPPAAQLDVWSPNNTFPIDTVYTLKQFTEVAMPPGVTSILDIQGGRDYGEQNYGTLIVGNNNKVYWSGTGTGFNINDKNIGNYLQVSSASRLMPDQCKEVTYGHSTSYYSWSYEAINFRGAHKLFESQYMQNQLGIIAKSGRGYFVGYLYPNTGAGKIQSVTDPWAIYPTPIANELLLSCNDSPGTGGPLGEPVSTPAVGVIDCSKTKLYPAPVQGTPSELSLLVTINVTTIGDFSPITISGSGMSLVSGFDKVTATTTGVQTFHIPIKYNGSTLTNNFQFTIGSAGSCSADLTNKPSNEITKVWSLNNCTAITPGVLSK
ncbi:hypothetical protein FHS57_004145 [Runella defluvii]|uniref:Uncharacterized protein n=1 Tax=Runella defluvii TaxID=370973 RepID=A0A7W5ZR60_9BACT|nr:hypothetical protein [Runella defluvii]MBB3840132.1 hypothetical protein [Runella defluvii]